MDITPEQEAFAEHAADMIVAAAQAMYPGDPVRMAAAALASVANVERLCPVVSNESLTLAPAELEQRIASPGAKFGGRR
jgi:hypothetical protein